MEDDLFIKQEDEQMLNAGQGDTTTMPTKKRTRSAMSDINKSSDSRPENKRATNSQSLVSDAQSLELQSCCSSPLNQTDPCDDIETASCCGHDECGVAIPWLDQIGKPLEVLGRGSSGEVTKVMWPGQQVALKTFMLKRNDPRDLSSAHESELEVLWDLKDLWGNVRPSLVVSQALGDFTNDWSRAWRATCR